MEISQPSVQKQDVVIEVDKVSLPGIMSVPEDAFCTVIFAHGSGSSRLSPRNMFVADELNKSNIATLLFDLLTEEESSVRRNVFDIGLLTKRLVATTRWVIENHYDSKRGIGYFGASTGAAAALKASVESEIPIKALVSRGGRPDLAWDTLEKVSAPTLLLVGSRDYEVIELNEIAYGKLHCPKKMELVKNATHLFEETGTLEYVADAAKQWFLQYLLIK